ncbi:hypothetical protein AGMMS50267_01560 [Spirochaetia bacterium]|nr:hypothetical protein AGMMS50267_01560 [Spirochaetia bacterium]
MNWTGPSANLKVGCPLSGAVVFAGVHAALNLPIDTLQTYGLTRAAAGRTLSQPKGWLPVIGRQWSVLGSTPVLSFLVDTLRVRRLGALSQPKG